MNFFDKADLGVEAMLAYDRAVKGKPLPPKSHFFQNPPSASAGFWPISGPMPTTIFEEMRAIKASADALDRDVQSQVQRQIFKDSWGAWYESWNKYYDKYLGPSSSAAKATVIPENVEVWQTVQKWREQLTSWYDGYGRESGPNGVPLRPTGNPPPKEPPPPPESEKSWWPSLNLPWWGISLITLGVIGAGVGLFYVIRKQSREAEEDRKMIRAHLPQILTRGAVSSAADPAPMTYHDPSPTLPDPP